MVEVGYEASVSEIKLWYYSEDCEAPSWNVKSHTKKKVKNLVKSTTSPEDCEAPSWDAKSHTKEGKGPC
jgi:hypothetical protein